MAQQVKLPPAMPTYCIGALIQILVALLMIQFPANVPYNTEIARVLGTLLNMQET